MKKKLFFLTLYFLVFFDFLFINIDLGIINITLLRIMIFVLFIYYMIIDLSQKKLNINKEVKLVSGLFVSWLIYIFISLFWVVDTGNVFRSIYYFLLFIMLMYLIIKLINTKESLYYMKSVVYYSTVIISFFGLIEYFTGIHMKPSRYNFPEFIELVDLYDKNVATGMFLNENDYSLFLALCLPFILIELLKKNKKTFILSVITTLMIIFLVVMNQSKLIIVMIAIEIIIFMLIINLSKLRKILILATMSVFSLIVLLLEGNILKNFGNIFSQLNDQNGSGFIRLNLIKNATYVLKENYFLGSGVRNFQYYLNPELDFRGITNPHNWWLELLTEHGIIVFIVFILFYTLMIVKLYKIYKNINNDLRYIYLAFFISGVSFILGSFSPSSMFYYWPMWLFFGLALAAVNIYNYQFSKK